MDLLQLTDRKGDFITVLSVFWSRVLLKDAQEKIFLAIFKRISALHCEGDIW